MHFSLGESGRSVADNGRAWGAGSLGPGEPRNDEEDDHGHHGHLDDDHAITLGPVTNDEDDEAMTVILWKLLNNTQDIIRF